MLLARAVLDPVLIFLATLSLVAALLTAATVRDAFDLRRFRLGEVGQLALATMLSACVAWGATGSRWPTVAIAAFASISCVAIRLWLPRLTMAGAMTMALIPLLLLASAGWTFLLFSALSYPLWVRIVGFSGLAFAFAASGFTFAGALARQAIFTHQSWMRPIRPLAGLRIVRPPKVSIQLPCYAEPPAMVIETMEHLARLDYPDFEVLVCDNNTKDEALWRPLEAHCARLNRRLGVERFRFFHVAPIEGAKAGALNFLMGVMAPDAELVAVVDADYLSRPDFLSRLVGFFEDPKVGYVQTPHDYRDYDDSAYLRKCYWEYMPSNKIDMSGVSEYDAAFTIGTMCLIRTQALRDAGGWAEWCLTEDSEVSVRLRALGYQGVYVRDTFGRGLIPDTFDDYKKQRFRWTAGPVQQLCRHWRLFLPGQWGHSRAMGGWSRLLEVQRCIAPLLALAQVLIAVTLGTAIAIATIEGAMPRLVLPAIAWGAILLGMAAMLIRKWHRYRLSGCRRIADMVGGEIAKMSLFYVMLVAGVAGLSSRPLAWRRTPKFRMRGRGLAALAATMPEALLGVLCLAAAAFLIVERSALGRDFVLLGLIGTLGYAARFFAAPVMALLAERHLEAQSGDDEAPVSPTVCEDLRAAA